MRLLPICCTRTSANGWPSVVVPTTSPKRSTASLPRSQAPACVRTRSPQTRSPRSRPCAATQACCPEPARGWVVRSGRHGQTFMSRGCAGLGQPQRPAHRRPLATRVLHLVRWHLKSRPNTPRCGCAEPVSGKQVARASSTRIRTMQRGTALACVTMLLFLIVGTLGACAARDEDPGRWPTEVNSPRVGDASSVPPPLPDSRFRDQRMAMVDRQISARGVKRRQGSRCNANRPTP